MDENIVKPHIYFLWLKPMSFLLLLILTEYIEEYQLLNWHCELQLQQIIKFYLLKYGLRNIILTHPNRNFCGT